MAALSGAKYLNGSSGNEGIFSNEEKWVKVVYDFAADTGAQADLDVLVNGSSSKAYAIVDFFAYVETGLSSSGSAVLDLGISAGGVDFWSNKDFATLTTGTVHGMGTAAPVKLPASGKVVLGIEAADLTTAGKIAFNFKVKQIV